MIKMICVNGYPGSGKTTFEDYCIDFLGKEWGKKISTIDVIKEICKDLGWDGVKTPESRKFLSEMKDLLSRAPWGDIPLMSIEDYCESLESWLSLFDQKEVRTFYVFVDAREPKNIEVLTEKYDAITVFIQRPLDLIDLSNHADKEVENYIYDYYINNSGSLEDLKKAAKDFIILLKESENE